MAVPGLALGNLPVGEWKAARGMRLSGGLVKGVRWDGEPVSDGWPGPIGRKLLALWHKDQKGGAGRSVPVHYDGSLLVPMVIDQV